MYHYVDKWGREENELRQAVYFQFMKTSGMDEDDDFAFMEKEAEGERQGSSSPMSMDYDVVKLDQKEEGNS